MSMYHFTLPWPVFDSMTSSFVSNRNDGILIDKDGNEVDAYTPIGTPAAITTGPSGTTVPFVASVAYGRVRFGSAEAAVFADENLDAAERAEAAVATSQQIVDKVNWIGENASEVTYLYRTLDGDVYVSETPVIQGGGKPRITSSGDVIVSFQV